jgi:hypothetical protein
MIQKWYHLNGREDIEGIKTKEEKCMRCGDKKKGGCGC